MADRSKSGRRWLVTGGTGQVGSALREVDLPPGVELVMPGRDELDLSTDPDFDGILAAGNVDLIINCAAYTAVDKAENEPDLAMAVNGRAPALLAGSAARAGIPVLHLSTDYVFDGTLRDRAYREDDPTGPISAYGRSKLAGEKGIADSAARALILRTAWVLSPFGGNFLKTMLRLGAERDRLGVVADQFGNPTSAHDIAAALCRIGDRLANDPDAPAGTFHFVNAGWTSWHGLADRIFGRALIHGRARPDLSAITTAEYPTPAARPSNSRLDTSLIESAYGISPRPWQEAVDTIVDRLCAAPQA